MILEILFNFIFCLVLTSSCHNTDNSKILYNYGDILEMHIFMNGVPQKFASYTLEEYKQGKTYPMTNFSFGNNNENILRQHQEIHPNIKVLDYDFDSRQYFLKFQLHYDLRNQRNYEKKLIVNIYPNQNLDAQSSNSVRHILSYSIKWDPLCIEFNHKQVNILEQNSNKEIVRIGEEYELTFEDGDIKKQMTHSINGEILWAWEDNELEKIPIRYRFRVERFDNNSKLKCLSNRGQIKLLVNKELEISHPQFSARNSTSVIPEKYTFKNGEEYEFSCEAKDIPGQGSSIVKWILLDANNIVKNASRNYRSFSNKFTLTNDEYDGAKLICFQYSCSISKTPNKTMECSRDIQKVINFQPQETTTTTVKQQEINPPKTTTIIVMTTPLSVATIASQTEVTNSLETPVNPSASFVGIIIGVIAGVMIIIILATLLFLNVKKRRKAEETRQEEPIYASSEIHYAVLDHTLRTNVNLPKKEEVLYSQVTGVLLPRKSDHHHRREAR